MELTEQELRAMIREAIARHGGDRRPPEPAFPTLSVHSSHGLLTTIGGGDADGNCLIEPVVRCNHCHYCQSLGH